MPPGVAVLPAAGWQIRPTDIPEPDILVVPRSGVGERVVEGTPLLVVEILSPSNHRTDLVWKRHLYAEAGCPSYWIVDQDGPTVTILDLDDGTYQETLTAKGDELVQVERPYPVTFKPSDLLRD
jgi:Uma2 family endonuclease